MALNPARLRCTCLRNWAPRCLRIVSALNYHTPEFLDALKSKRNLFRREVTITVLLRYMCTPDESCVWCRRSKHPTGGLITFPYSRIREIGPSSSSMFQIYVRGGPYCCTSLLYRPTANSSGRDVSSRLHHHYPETSVQMTVSTVPSTGSLSLYLQ